MARFDPLAFSTALLPLSSLSAAQDRSRLQHVPLLQALFHVVRPRVYVELGADLDSTYLAACQAVTAQGLDCRCYGLVAMEGEQLDRRSRPLIDPQRRAEHLASYGAVSQLGEPDDALFAELDPALPPIDLLLIDGRRTYQAVAQDLARFSSRLSPQGIVLIHGTAPQTPGFGASRLWSELAPRGPHVHLGHGDGLGLLAIGADLPEALRELLSPDTVAAGPVAAWLAALGEQLALQADLAQARRELLAYIPAMQDAQRALRSVEQQASQDLAALRQQLAAVECEREQQRGIAASLRERITQLEDTLTSVNGCLSFRIGMAATAPLRWVAKRLQPSTGSAAS